MCHHPPYGAAAPGGSCAARTDRATPRSWRPRLAAAAGSCEPDLAPWLFDARRLLRVLTEEPLHDQVPKAGIPRTFRAAAGKRLA